MKVAISISFIYSLLLFCISSSHAQQRIEVINADTFEFRERGANETRRLVGNVVFRQGEVTMRSDSAFHYVRTNTLDAFGNIHIQQSDTINIYGNTLNYNGNSRIAILRGNTRMMDPTMTLTTPSLLYDMNSGMGSYTEGGVIVSEENTLTSQRGYYHSNTNDMYFRENVELLNPQYVMNSDTLRYNISSGIAYFHGPTTITSDDNLIYCENGWYDTRADISRFGKNAYLRSGSQYMYADSLFYDRNQGIGRARENISVIDTAEDLTIKGLFAQYFEHDRLTYITGKVLLIKPFENDTFFLTSDTLSAGYDTSGVHRILWAYYNAKSYSDNFQSVSDSLVYTFSDSTIRLYHDPLFWFDEYQGIADDIEIKTSGNEISQVFLTGNAFIASAEDSFRFNQVKGRAMTGFFESGELKRVKVEGNGESIYFIKDDDEKYIGVNKIESSEIMMHVSERKIQRIVFQQLPSGTMFPFGHQSNEALLLPGFRWEIEKKPERFNWWDEDGRE